MGMEYDWRGESRDRCECHCFLPVTSLKTVKF